MKLWRLCALFVASFVFNLPIQAAPIEAYGKLPSIQDIEISPDGKRIAYFTTINEQSFTLIQDLNGNTKPILVNNKNGKPVALTWAGNEYLVITVFITSDAAPGTEAPRQQYHIAIVLNIASGKAQLLESDNGLNFVYRIPFVRMVNGSPIVFYLAPTFVSKYETRTNSKDENSYERRGAPSLYSYNPLTGKSNLVLVAYPDAEDYVVDPDGNAVARSFYDRKRWILEIKRGDEWEKIKDIDAPIDSPTLLGLGRTKETILFTTSGKDQDDAGGVQEIRLDGSGAELTSPVGKQSRSFLHDPTTGLVIGQFGRADHNVFYDPSVQKVWASILRAFGGEMVEFISMSEDRQRIIVHVFGQKNGESYLLIDRSTGKADLIGDIYDQLPPEAIASVREITYKAEDGLEIPAILTLPKGQELKKNQPLIVLPHGGPVGRDFVTFNWWAQALAARGYAVLQPQFRGSSGYGQPFVEAAYGQWGRKMQTDISDGVRYLANAHLIDPNRVCIVGASYGGYAALLGVTLQSGLYRCAVSVGGISNIERFLLWNKNRTLFGEDFTHLKRTMSRWLGTENTNSPVLKELSPTYLADKATAPILLIHSQDDTVVPFTQSKLMFDALKEAGKQVELIPLQGEDHRLTNSKTRMQMLQETIRFIELHNPPDPQVEESAKAAQ